MYSQKVTSAQLSKIQETKPYELEYSSSRNIEYNRKYIDSCAKWDDRGRIVGWNKPLTTEILDWIDNERAIARWDFRYFFSNYSTIKDVTGNKVHPQPNIAQNIVMDIWGEMEELLLPITMAQLKARQLGVSTLSEHAIDHRAQMFDDVNAVVASSEEKKSRKMIKMIELSLEKMPWWLMPQITAHQTGKFIEFGKKNSVIYIEWGTAKSGLGRGDTPDVFHFSELPDWDDPGLSIDDALMKAIHENPWTFGILESTAKGASGWWYDTWWECYRNWPNAPFRSIFLPWFVGRDIYPMPTWLRQRWSIYEAWIPKPQTIQMANKAKEIVSKDPFLQKHLGSNWFMDREQMFFWEKDRDFAREKGRLPEWLAEMPMTPDEAFASSTTNVFDAETIQIFSNSTQVPEGIYGILGHDIPLRHQPELVEIDENEKPIPVYYRSDSESIDYLLVPLRKDIINPWDYRTAEGKLLIWHMPDLTGIYGAGIDPADGVGGNRLALELIRRGIPGVRKNQQVAEFFSTQVGALEFWAILLCILTFYSPDPENQCKAVIECGKGGGGAMQSEIMKRGWWNVHYDIPTERRKSKTQQIIPPGWFTKELNRADVVTFLKRALIDQWIEINSPYFVSEMKSLIKDFEKQPHLGGRIQAGNQSDGKPGFDDLYMAMGIDVMSMYFMELYTGKLDIRPPVEQLEHEKVKYPVIQEQKLGIYYEDQTEEYLSDLIDFGEYGDVL